MTPQLTPEDAAVSELLFRHACPVSFPNARAFVMGSIACPNESISAQTVIRALWRGNPPEFTVALEAHRFAEVLIDNFWNSLLVHQDRSRPFRLLRGPCGPTMRHMGNYAKIRQEEVAGFFDGLCGPADDLVLPSRANRALDALNEIAPLLAGLAKLSLTRLQKAQLEEVKLMISQIDELSETAESEINAAIQACGKTRINRVINLSDRRRLN